MRLFKLILHVLPVSYVNKEGEAYSNTRVTTQININSTRVVVESTQVRKGCDTSQLEFSTISTSVRTSLTEIYHYENTFFLHCLFFVFTLATLYIKTCLRVILSWQYISFLVFVIPYFVRYSLLYHINYFKNK